MQSLDLQTEELRALNARLYARSETTYKRDWKIPNLKGGHALAVGLDAPVEVTVRGSVKSLGADCIEKEMRNHLTVLTRDTAETPCYDQQAIMRRHDGIAEIRDYLIEPAGTPVIATMRPPLARSR